MRSCLLFVFSFILVGLLTACGDNTSPSPTSGSVVGTATPVATSSPGKTIPFTQPTNFPSKLTPTVGYIAQFDYENGQPLLTTNITTPLPKGGPDDWIIVIESNGVAQLTLQPDDPTKTQTSEYYLSQSKLDNLLVQLVNLGVLDWPEQPAQIATCGTVRGLNLNLKGKAKKIYDMYTASQDRLDQIMTLVRKTVEEAPPRNSP